MRNSGYVDKRMVQVKGLLEARQAYAKTQNLEGKGLGLVNDEPHTVIIRGDGAGNIKPELCEGLPMEYWTPLRDALKEYFDKCSELLAPNGNLPI